MRLSLKFGAAAYAIAYAAALAIGAAKYRK